jgi:hypothetical protein
LEGKEVYDDVLLLSPDETRSLPVPRCNVPELPSVREPLLVHPETERSGVREAEAVGEARLKSRSVARKVTATNRLSRGRPNGTRAPMRRTTVLRKLILSAVVAAGIVTGLCVPPPAEASPPTQPDRYYEVLVLGPQGWESYGAYMIHAEARREAIRLWREEYRVAIREF